MQQDTPEFIHTREGHLYHYNQETDLYHLVGRSGLVPYQSRIVRRRVKVRHSLLPSLLVLVCIFGVVLALTPMLLGNSAVKKSVLGLSLPTHGISSSSHPTPLGNYDVRLLGHAPRISVEKINAILAQAGSPAIGTGAALYALGIQNGIDALYALAFFQHESTFGLYGWARPNHSLGNKRCTPDLPCNGGYAYYQTWEQGYSDWYKLISVQYVGWYHLYTVAQIVPRYAPTADNNDEAAYIASVEHQVYIWTR